ncbi:hypothetical protein [Mycobacterium sp. URHB0044]|uniref:hypothetical protein n=1 Tax=Mycobacterium sp. URHB0044 TaxID=1380386 RepID=UPI0012DE594C|nr:hypothetical protein [Mycobacterium sp. URHB0044]
MEADSDARQQWLAWLADAPLFIDDEQIRAMYDAVLRPAYNETEVQLTAQQANSLDRTAGLRGTLGLGNLFPWLKAEIGSELTEKHGTNETSGRTVKLVPTDSPTRQLVELGLHYVLNLPSDRTWICPTGENWQPPSREDIIGSPRILAAIDFPERTQFLPSAAELNDGRVITFFEPLTKAFIKDGDSLPIRYPDNPSANDFAIQRDAYWAWFSDRWDANKVVRVIETTIGSGGRPRWIDYRVVTPGGPIHLHLVGRGNVDTGIFAYNVVKRGWSYGVRAIGTVKSKPDINVFAIYEK